MSEKIKMWVDENMETRIIENALKLNISVVDLIDRYVRRELYIKKYIKNIILFFITSLIMYIIISLFKYLNISSFVRIILQIMVGCLVYFIWNIKYIKKIIKMKD